MVQQAHLVTKDHAVPLVLLAGQESVGKRDL